MCPPSTPINAAILPSFRASRTSAAVVAKTMSVECLRTCSRTASICTSARSTASRPVTLLGIQMEKKIALRFPSRMRGMSMLPVALRVGAFLNSSRPHDCRDPLALVHRSRGMHIEETHLANDRCAHELVVLIHLRANLQAVPARDAIRKRIPFFLLFRRHSRPFAEIVGAVNGNPRFHAFQAFKHELPVDGQIAHQRGLGHRLDSYRLFVVIHVRLTRHSRFPLDLHRKG